APELLNGLWRQAETRTVTSDGLALALAGDQCAPGETTAMPSLPSLADGGGFTIDLWLTPDAQPSEQEIFNTRTRAGRGISLSLLRTGVLRLTIADGALEQLWESDPGLLSAGMLHHAAIIVDGGPKIITFVIDGVLNDGGTFRPRGWSRFSSMLGNINGVTTLTIDPALMSTLHTLRIYDRAVRTSEAVANFQAMD
ncbi:MAG TPA: LamG-like jellyroll fold domain-containing protein, partial [Thermomicrobiales bacterium]|nr:LamG-like jellyroll fold domain-containing protein [Thermomicrobiales bacterium]